MDYYLKRGMQVLILLLCSHTIFAQDPVPLTLENAIEYAMQNSNEIKNAQINIVDAEERIIENRAIGIPKINGGVDYQRYLQVPVQALPDAFVDFLSAMNPNEPVSREVSFFLRNNFSYNIGIDALIFDGSYLTALKAAKVYRRYVEEDLQVKRRNVRNSVIDAYLPVLLVDKNLEILDLNLANLEKLQQETQALYDEGFAEQLDVDRLSLSLANLRVEKENLMRQREIAADVLKFTLNLPKDQTIEIEEDLEDLVVEAEVSELSGDYNLNVRPEIQYVNTGIELSDMNVQLNKMEYLPKLRAFASYTQTYQSNTREDGFWAPQALAGLSLSVPIFDGWGRKAKVQRAQLTKEINLNQKDDLVRSIQLEIENARKVYQTAKESLDSQKQNLDLAQRIYDTTQIKYREGVGSSIEVNQAEQSLYTSQANYIQALYNLTTARFDLRKALGN